MAETLYLVDGSSILYRAYFAVRGLSTRDGRPTNAIFGTLKMAEKLLKDRRPSHIAIVFDLPAPTFRHEAYAGYKANRPDTPDDLVAQIGPSKEILRAMGLPVLELAGYEADDLIGTLAGRAREAGFEVVVATADKDLFQLVRDGVRILYTNDESLLDARGVEEKFGVPPGKVADVLALWGDPTDNIPGVPGIGEKGAKELVKQYGNLEAVLAHAADVTRKAYREGLLNHADSARMSRELATVKCDVELSWTPRDLRRSEPDRERLQALFAEYEFTSLLGTWPAAGESAAEEIAVGARPLDAAGLSALSKADAVGLAREGAALLLSEGTAVWRTEAGDAPVALLEQAPLCAHDLKPLLREALLPAGAADDFEAAFTRRVSPEAAPPRFTPGTRFLDAAVAGYLLDASAKVPDVAELAATHLCVRVDVADAAARAMALARLRAPIEAALAAAGMTALWRDLERPLVAALARMEAAGVAVDTAYFRELSREMGESLARLGKEIQAAAGTEFNPASPKQVGEVLFGKLNLPVQKRTGKTRSPSTDSEVLESLRPLHPVVPLLLEHRLLAKLKGTYLDPLPAWVNPATGRVHAYFNQTVAATGRLSSSEPNLQNIPMKGAWGPRIRHGFVAAPGHRLVGADYSQIELRILAHLSGDPALVRVFAQGRDIHASTAAEVFKVAPGAVTPDMRRQAKAVNFGILYGMGAFGLARELGVSQRDAKAFIERYFEGFPRVRAYIEGVERTALETGQVTTLLGRRRLFPGIARAAKPLQQALLRQAVNTTVQGSAADLIKKAMVEVEPRLSGGARLVLQVHDELIVECPADQAPRAAAVLKEAMEGALALSVPMAASVSTGTRWDALK